VCGIIGSVRDAFCLPESTSVRMRDSLAHRGPDDAGLWMAPAAGVTLGSRRLAILDLSPRGHQPMQDLSKTLTIVFNGEIYNYRELRKELERNYLFQSHSDTEVLLAAYSHWGTDFLERLNGMFAFAIWDSKRQCLFAARDRFGEKPFYYIRRSGLFMFASEIKALLASGMIDPEPNPTVVYRFLAYRETDASEETFFKDLFALLPAHGLLYFPRQDRLRFWRYWDLDPAMTIRHANDESYSEHFLDLLRQSIEIRLRSDVPVGSCLSGGIDSSSIVSLLSAQRRGEKQATFSARFKDPAIDEGKYIESVSNRLSVANYTTYPDPHRMIEELDEFIWHQEHPFVGPSIYAQWCVMRLAKDRDVTVLLDGQGADESLAGYLASQSFYYRDLFADFRWITLARSAFTQCKLSGLHAVAGAVIPQLPVIGSRVASLLGNRTCLLPDFSTIAFAPPTVAPAKFKSALNNELYQQMRCSMLPKLLRFADRSSMAFSRETRLPFLDHRLVEFLFAIPEAQKIRGTTTKLVLRNAMRGKLPDEVLNRTDKKGFETPQATWLRGSLRPWAESMLYSASFRERGWIDQKAALRVWRRFLSQPYLHQAVLFRWLSLEAWARMYLKSSATLSAVAEEKIQVNRALHTRHGTLAKEL
jgi:asparagine synthase (glutamine-hydrolysing)